jgi:NAD-dependent dihydropyrimidine dehydrogenase PreA subunit
MKRTIIEIDQSTCDGCGACETGCPEGAIKIVDGKARMVGESLCDGLGACIGRCPRGAITVLEREADEYDEIAVIERLIPQGAGVLAAHFTHLDGHGQSLYLEKAARYLAERGIAVPAGFENYTAPKKPSFIKSCGFALKSSPKPAEATMSARFPDKPSGGSSLKNWPIQLHLANPKSPQFAGADIVVAADCTAFALGSFHSDIISGKSLVIACPKLDSGKDLYLAKLSTMFAEAKSIAVVIMEVPCCSGLLSLVKSARESANSKLPIEALVVGIEGGFVARRTFE